VVRLRRTLWRSGVLVCAAVMVVLLAGCNRIQSVDLDVRPTDVNTMRDLAYSVAANAVCGDVEWYSDQENARSFTCERSDGRGQAYIMAATEVAPLDERAAYLDGLNVPYVRGQYYLVTVPINRASTAAPLDEFSAGAS